jgi:hypothetical protein
MFHLGNLFEIVRALAVKRYISGTEIVSPAMKEIIKEKVSGI